MVRRLPQDSNFAIHPALSLSLIAAWIAAIVAVITALCSIRSKKGTAAKSSKPTSPSQPLPEKTDKASEDPPIEKPLPLPPALQKGAEKANQIQEQVPLSSPSKRNQAFTNALPEKTKTGPTSISTASTRKLMVSLSMKLPRTLSKMRLRKESDAQGESLWTKTIMLGEKCRVPGDDEDTIIYDERGNRIPAYPSRGPRSLPVSRSNSYIDPNAVPVSNL